VDKDIIRLLEELKGPDSFVVLSTDGTILEMTQGNVYIRILVGESRSSEKPFSFSKYVSAGNERLPKTEFFITPYNPKYLSKAQVLAELQKLKK
jgi:hypothetical protein